MAKKTRNRAAAASAPGENPRRPCPCGSGKRYKVCHGAGDDVIVIRPFDGLAAEPDLVAMREFLPSATAPLPLRDNGERPVTVTSVLPGASAALVRADGSIMIGMQVQTRSGDLSADVARAVRWAQQAEAGESLPVVGPGLGGDPVRLQDLLDPDATLDLTMHQDFGWWVPEQDGDLAPELAAMLERANSVIMPTEPVVADGVRAAYWVDTGSKAHIRWVRPEPEDRLLAAMARLQAGDGLALSGDARYLGSFRAHGLLVPVWDLDRDLHPKEWTAPVAAFAARLDEALAGLDDTPPTDAERRARDALAGKQVTLR
ncbi:MAG: SEC-C domain-containing protein [Pseudonocardiaceae bacterium]|nr:MAG: SEC-C domain-containing protein [Pseudonocardiaceae bacterium]